MAANFVVEIHNRTITDVTKMAVSSDVPQRIKPFNMEAIPAGNSYDFQLLEDSTIGEKILSLFGQTPRQYKLNFVTTFSNTTTDSFTVFLKGDNSLIKCEKAIETHRVSVQVTQNNKKMSITFENTERQIENHEAQRLHQQATVLMSQQKFAEACAKLNEALKKAYETPTITIILKYLSQIEDIMDHRAKMMCDEGLKLLSDNNYEDALDKFRESLQYAKKEETISSIQSNIIKTQEMKIYQEKSEELTKKAVTLSNLQHYEEALKLFEEALTYAKKKETTFVLKTHISHLKDIKTSEDKCEEMVENAKLLLSNRLYEEALKKFDMALTFTKKMQTIEIITSYINTTRSLATDKRRNKETNDSENSEELVNEAKSLLSQHQYEEALEQLEEALMVAKKKETLLLVATTMKHVKDAQKTQQKSEEMVKEAESHEEALKKFEAALTFAQKKQTVDAITSQINTPSTSKINERIAEEMKKEEQLKKRQEKAEELVAEAEASVGRHEYEEALKIFEESLLYARKKETIVAARKNIEQLKDINKSQQKCENLVKEAEGLLSNHSYEEALKKFEAAVRFAKKKQTVELIMDHMTGTRALIRKKHKAEEMMREAEVRSGQVRSEEIEQIVKEAEALLGGFFYDEALKKFEAALSLAKKTETVEFIKSSMNKACTLRKNEDKAEQMKKDAVVLLDQHKHNQALNKLHEALKYTQKDTTLIKESIQRVHISKKREQKAQKLITQGEMLLNSHSYDQALKNFDEALKATTNAETINLIKSNKSRIQQEKDNHSKAVKLNAEALLLEHKKAIKKLNEALKIAKEETLVDTIKANKASVFNRQGEQLLVAVCNAEESPENKATEVAQKLAQAKNFFMQANTICSNASYDDNIKIADCKIQGNKSCRAGVVQEREAALLIEKIDSLSTCKEAIAKCEAVRGNYASALQIFRDGMKISEEMFKCRVKVVDEALRGVEEVLDELERCELGYQVEAIKGKASQISQEILSKQCVRLNNCHFVG